MVRVLVVVDGYVTADGLKAADPVEHAEENIYGKNEHRQKSVDDKHKFQDVGNKIREFIYRVPHEQPAVDCQCPDTFKKARNFLGDCNDLHLF
jgi:hypothetical protein